MLNSVLLDGILVNNPTEKKGVSSFRIDSNGLRATIILQDRFTLPSTVMHLRKGGYVRVVGKLSKNGIIAEHIELRNARSIKFEGV